MKESHETNLNNLLNENFKNVLNLKKNINELDSFHYYDHFTWLKEREDSEQDFNSLFIKGHMSNAEKLNVIFCEEKDFKKIEKLKDKMETPRQMMRVIERIESLHEIKKFISLSVYASKMQGLIEELDRLGMQNKNIDLKYNAFYNQEEYSNSLENYTSQVESDTKKITTKERKNDSQKILLEKDFFSDSAELFSGELSAEEIFKKTKTTLALMFKKQLDDIEKQKKSYEKDVIELRNESDFNKNEYNEYVEKKKLVSSWIGYNDQVEALHILRKHPKQKLYEKLYEAEHNNLQKKYEDIKNRQENFEGCFSKIEHVCQPGLDIKEHEAKNRNALIMLRHLLLGIVVKSTYFEKTTVIDMNARKDVYDPACYPDLTNATNLLFMLDVILGLREVNGNLTNLGEAFDNDRRDYMNNRKDRDNNYLLGNDVYAMMDFMKIFCDYPNILAEKKVEQNENGITLRGLAERRHCSGNFLSIVENEGNYKPTIFVETNENKNEHHKIVDNLYSTILSNMKNFKKEQLCTNLQLLNQIKMITNLLKDEHWKKTTWFGQVPTTIEKINKILENNLNSRSTRSTPKELLDEIEKILSSKINKFGGLFFTNKWAKSVYKMLHTTIKDMRDYNETGEYSITAIGLRTGIKAFEMHLKDMKQGVPSQDMWNFKEAKLEIPEIYEKECTILKEEIKTLREERKNKKESAGKEKIEIQIKAKKFDIVQKKNPELAGKNSMFYKKNANTFGLLWSIKGDSTEKDEIKAKLYSAYKSKN